MDLNSYWQENRRFLLAVAGGVVAFLIGWMIIDRIYGSDLTAQVKRRGSIQKSLREAMFTSADLSEARAQNEALRAAVAELARHAEFRPREEFVLREGDAPSSRYFAVVTDVRDDLRSRCSRAGLSIPDELGLPKLSPTRPQEIARYLEGLDVVEATIQMAIEAGVRRIDEIQIDVDNRLLSGKPIDDLEKTLIELRIVGESPPMVALFELLEQERDGRVVLIERLAMAPARGRGDDVRMDLVLAVPHLHGVGALEPEGEG